MAIQFQPTIQDICRIALRGAGQPAPSAGMIQEAAENQFREVLNDIKEHAATHPLLETSEVKVNTAYLRSLAQPTTCNVVKSVLLLDGPTGWRLASQGATTTTFSTPVSFTETAANIKGKEIYFISGAGINQRSWITAFSSNSITFSPAVTTSPIAGTTCQIVNHQREIFNCTKQLLNDNSWQFAEPGRPERAAIGGETLWFDRPPDLVYPIYWTYYFDIDQLNESSTLGKKILREWRSLLVEGVRAKSMFIYDDTRQYEHHKGIYEMKLNTLASETIEVRQTNPYDVIIN